MVVSAALAVVTLAGAATLPVVYALATLGGLALVFDAPGRQALTFQMVGPRELGNAVALNSSLFNASRVIGPAIAGVLIAAVGTGWCFVVNTASFVAVLAALVAMRPEELVEVEKDRDATVVGGIREGFRWVVGDHTARTVLVVVTALSALGFNFHVLVPLLGSSALDVGPRGFGLLSTAFGLGALAGALLAASAREATYPAVRRGRRGVRRAAGRARAGRQRTGGARAARRARGGVHAAHDLGERPGAARRAGSAAGAGDRDLPLRLRGAHTDRRAGRRVAGRGRRDAAGVRGGRGERARGERVGGADARAGAAVAVGEAVA